MLPLDYYERRGFRECDSSCLSRNSKTILFQDFPILRKIRPILTGMRRLDQVAFAAELLELGYSLGKVRYGSELAITTIAKLRDRMKARGWIPEHCNCGRELGHGGWCPGRRGGKKMKAATPASFTTENQPRLARSGHRGVYRKGSKWSVQRRINGKTQRFGAFERLEDAIQKRNEVFKETM